MSFRKFLPCFLLASGLAATAYAQDYKQNALCVDGTDRLCGTLPVDLPDLRVPNGYEPNTDPVNPGSMVGQINFDYFSWQMFVALNWPADTAGRPVGRIDSGLNTPRVWESYLTVDEVFPPDNQPATTCGNARLALFETSKLRTSSFVEPFTPYPMIDHAGNYVMYDIRLNDIEAKYIKDNGLDTKAGQKAFGKPWDFPTGKGSTPGAIELKTAWRIFPPGADSSGYFTVPAIVTVPAKNSATGEVLCLEVTAGLVGMHLMEKITNPETFSDFWVWATFEHVRNAPDAEGATVSQVNRLSTAHEKDPAACNLPTKVSGDWAFFDAACTESGQACAPNGPPARPNNDKPYQWQPKPPYAKDYLHDRKYGTQAVRCWKIYETAETVDAKFQKALAGTVWANYQLVGAQWAQAAIVEYPDPLKPFPAPIYLTNTTLETYLQVEPVLNPAGTGPSKKASGSCITCHDLATDTAGNDANFSFLAGYAQ